MDNDTDRGKVHDVAPHNQSNSQDVVPKHLPMIFSSLLAVDNEQLVEPPTELGEIVKLGECRERDGRVCAPELFGRCWRGILAEDNLQREKKGQALASGAMTENSTHHAKRPIYRAIQPAPALLCKPRDGMLPLLPGLCIFSLLSLDLWRAWQTYSHKGREDTLHERLPEQGERQRPEEHQARILRALVVQCLRGRVGERVCDGIRQGDKGPQRLWDIGVEEGGEGGGGEVARHAGGVRCCSKCGCRVGGREQCSPRSQLVGVWLPVRGEGGRFLTGKEKAALGCGLDSSRNRCACEKLNLRLYLLPRSPLQGLSLAITMF